MPHATFDLVGIEKTASVDYLERIFACYRDGRVAVPVDSGADAPEGYTFNERVVPAKGGGWFVLSQAPQRSDAPAQISFSSGTTGTPKANLLSHRALADVTDRLIEVMGIDSEIREYLGVPPTYSFGLARARAIAAVGGQLYIPQNGFDPSELARMLDAGEINALSAVPTLLRILIANPELIEREVARKLRWLEIGSQPMSQADKQAIRHMFPEARIVQHYGLTEASRTTFLDLQRASDADLASVGKPIGATEVQIDQAGHICIRGPHLADGILTANGVEAIADEAGWLRTNDLGRIDESGFLHFEGRSDSLLNIGGIKVPAELFEERLLARLGVDPAHIAVTGRADALRGEVVLVAHLPEIQAAQIVDHVRAIGASFGLGNADVAIVQVDEIPRTETGKVRRAALVERPAQVAPLTSTSESSLGDDGFHNDREREIAAIWREALGVADIARTDTFFDMGGDSLSAITAMLRMERAGIPKDISQQIFEGRSIADIANDDDSADSGAPRSRRSRRAEVSDAITMTRGIMVLVVLAGHWGPFVLLRMGDLSGPLMYWTIPLFHLGTPGFAMMFGMGLAFFNLGMVKNHADRFRANIRSNLMIVGCAVVALALLRGTAMALLDPAVITVSNLFFGVLVAYLILVAASGVVLRFIASRRYPILSAISMALVSLTVSAVCNMFWGRVHTSGAVDLIRLLIVTNYGFPHMLGFAGIGIAIGLWIERSQEQDDLSTQAILAGVALLTGSALLTVSFVTEATWFGDAGVHEIVAYSGVLLLLFATMLKAIHNGLADRVLKVPLRILIMIGILGFIIYVGHELVMSIVAILVTSHVPYFAAVSVPVLTFLLACVIAARRLYKLYFG